MGSPNLRVDTRSLKALLTIAPFQEKSQKGSEQSSTRPADREEQMQNEGTIRLVEMQQRKFVVLEDISLTFYPDTA